MRRGEICGDIVPLHSPVEVQLGELRVNQAAGNEVICGSERDAVAKLCVAKLRDSE